jgi:hypothetical protein
MANTQKNYAQVMMEAAEHVYVFALRRGIDAGVISASFDIGRGDGAHTSHTLTIAVRHSGISVTKENIPHAWLAGGTAFIDVEFSQFVSELLQELETAVLCNASHGDAARWPAFRH